MRPMLALALLAAALVACDTTTRVDMVYDAPDGSQGQVTFAQIQQQVLTPACAVSGCHAGSYSPNLSAGEAWAALVGHPSNYGMLLVQPGQPDSSFLYIKITGGPGLLGSRMPLGGTPLPQVSIDAVRTWIEAGALND